MTVEKVIFIVGLLTVSFWLIPALILTLKVRHMEGLEPDLKKQLIIPMWTVPLIGNLVGSFKHIRRYSLGYHHEMKIIRGWLNQIKAQVTASPQVALEIAFCGRLVKGYGGTRERTSEQVSVICQNASSNEHISAEYIVNLRAAAMADDTNEAFHTILSES